MIYSYPKTKEEYWLIVSKYWNNLVDIMVQFCPDDVEKAHTMRLTKNPEIVHIFNNSWANAPDSPSIHYIPSWNVLCDLCSESYLLFDSDE